MLYIKRKVIISSRGGESGPFWTGSVNTILKEMGPFSASSKWHEWINFHSKWVSYWPGHSIWVPFTHSGSAIFFTLGRPFKQVLQSKVEMGFYMKLAFK